MDHLLMTTSEEAVTKAMLMAVLNCALVIVMYALCFEV